MCQDNLEAPILMQMDECVSHMLPEPRTLLQVLHDALPQELFSEIGFVQLHQISSLVKTTPPLRAVCLECTFLDHDGHPVPLSGIWYLTSDSWKKPFVAAFAEAGSNVVPLQAPAHR